MLNIFSTLSTKLYFRIWIALVLAITLLTLVLGWTNRITHEPPPREITVRNNEGVIIAHGFVRKKPSQSSDDQDAQVNETSKSSEPPLLHGLYGPGSEFLVQTTEGAWLHIYLPHNFERSVWNRRKYGWLWLLILVGVSACIATYPVTRRLTRRLENLQKSVEIWGSGNLSARADIEGRDEIAYLAHQFNHSANQIEVLLAAHKTLLANASHELRTPLARIRMALELMGQGAEPNLKNEMTRNVLELDQLIHEILTASRLDAPQADLGPLEVVDLTGLASEECSHANAELELGDTPQSYITLGNAQLLRRVIRNLLENAVKHGNPAHYAARASNSAPNSHNEPSNENPVVLHISTKPATQLESPAFIRIAVMDRGPGVAPHERTKIFEPFYRSQNRRPLPENDSRANTAQSSGAGLGLSLVKTICERHKGSVHYEDRTGGGSCFVVYLPQHFEST